MANKRNTCSAVNVAIWIILSVIICIGLLLLYNKTVFEKFEEEDKKPKPEPVPVVEEPKKNIEMDNTEQNIFDKIIRNELKADDLQKLINAGIVTQNMVEKFLSKIDSKEKEESEGGKIEAFSNANSMYSRL